MCIRDRYTYTTEERATLPIYNTYCNCNQTHLGHTNGCPVYKHTRSLWRRSLVTRNCGKWLWRWVILISPYYLRRQTMRLFQTHAKLLNLMYTVYIEEFQTLNHNEIVKTVWEETYMSKVWKIKNQHKSITSLQKAKEIKKYECRTPLSLSHVTMPSTF